MPTVWRRGAGIEDGNAVHLRYRRHNLNELEPRMQEILSVAQAGAFLGVSRRLLYALWDRADGPKFALVGRRRLIRRRACEEFLAAREAGICLPQPADQPAPKSLGRSDA